MNGQIPGHEREDDGVKRAEYGYVKVDE